MPRGQKWEARVNYSQGLHLGDMIGKSVVFMAVIESRPTAHREGHGDRGPVIRHRWQAVCPVGEMAVADWCRDASGLVVNLPTP